LDSVGSGQRHITDSWEYGDDHFGFKTPRDFPRYLREYHYKKDPLIQTVRTQQHITNLAMLQRARSLKRKLQRRISEIKDSTEEKTKEILRGKKFRRQFAHNLDEKLVDNKQSHRRLKFGDISVEKGSTTVLWNQAVHTDREVAANMPYRFAKNKKDRQCTYQVTLKRVRATVVAVDEQKVLHSLCVCSLRYPACNAHAPYCHL